MSWVLVAVSSLVDAEPVVDTLCPNSVGPYHILLKSGEYAQTIMEVFYVMLFAVLN